MQDDNWVFIWIIGVISLIVGMIIGFFINKISSGKDSQINNLEKELEQNKKEMNEYRDQVNEHFARSSELFDQMTGSYRALFLHLASGAEHLSNFDLDLSLLNPPDVESSNELSSLLSENEENKNDDVTINEEKNESEEKLDDILENNIINDENTSKEHRPDEVISKGTSPVENQINKSIDEDQSKINKQP